MYILYELGGNGYEQTESGNHWMWICGIFYGICADAKRTFFFGQVMRKRNGQVARKGFVVLLQA